FALWTGNQITEFQFLFNLKSLNKRVTAVPKAVTRSIRPSAMTAFLCLTLVVVFLLFVGHAGYFMQCLFL
ncbi:MAG TPA: hypothetical protein PL048_04340, partial [Leptospiraceae bacterium]|nr:hypothetical protein [Leptospiraceae bacterium]